MERLQAETPTSTIQQGWAQQHTNGMNSEDRFALLSPLEFRYVPQGSEAGERIRAYLSEEADVRYLALVEAALAWALADLGLCSTDVAQAVETAASQVTARDVYDEEQRTRHNIRALVNCIRRHLADDSRPFVHLFVTSADIMDTANALRYKEFCRDVLLPSLVDLNQVLIEFAERHATTKQIGRTHGKYAEPITFGFAVALYVERLGDRIRAVDRARRGLRGKISGAVGAYNSMSLAFPDDPSRLEERVLARLGLTVHDTGISTQIVPPESMTDLTYAVISCFSVLANLADDLRHLHRSEIAEVQERYGEAEVGSSTMPHKRNPRSFENVKSLWKAMMPRMLTSFLDQVSEHQRDLTNSASARFTPEIFASLDYSARRLADALRQLDVDDAAMKKNLQRALREVGAEPLYITLALLGYPDAYDKARNLARQARESGVSLVELLEQDLDLQPYVSQLTEARWTVLRDPSQYIGDAIRKTEQTCSHWRHELNSLMSGLEQEPRLNLLPFHRGTV